MRLETHWIYQILRIPYSINLILIIPYASICTILGISKIYYTTTDQSWLRAKSQKFLFLRKTLALSTRIARFVAAALSRYSVSCQPETCTYIRGFLVMKDFKTF